MSEFVQRAASLGDLKNLWELVRAAADDIPLDLSGEAAQERQLEKLGFAHECAAASGWGDLYVWQPAAAGH